MKNFILLFLLIFGSFFGSLATAAESIKADHVQIRWLVPETFGSEPTTIGVYFQTDPEWHVYWKNPGDSGAAPKFNIIAKGGTVGPIQWPYPERLPIAHLTNLGYKNPVAYLLEIKPTGSTINLEAKLEWLVCKEECVPGFATLRFTRKVEGKISRWKMNELKIVQKFQERIPQLEKESPWKISEAILSNSQLKLKLNGPLSTETSLDLYPIEGEFILPSKPIVIKNENDFEFIFKTTPGKSANQTGFILVSGEKAWQFDQIQISNNSTLSQSDQNFSFLILLMSAFLGGILLNLMPCVFPVLSIKIFSLLKKDQGNLSFRTRFREAIFYTAGVLTTFTLLGAVFLILRAGGESIGWGFQLQSPEIVLILVLLFWLIGLNFLGAFDFGNSLMIFAGKKDRFSSPFATGILSVFVAAPCTGPFMGSALGASSTLAPIEAMSIFLSLGLGLALPFLILALSPALLKLLPKPGAWMERFKQFLAFPIFATVLWLLSVFAEQTGNSGWILGTTLLLIVTFALWLLRSKLHLIRIFGVILGFISFALSIKAIDSFNSVTMTEKNHSQTDRWNPYHRSSIESALAEKRAVFIDFTAAWCITCQVNKKVVLETAKVTELFEKNNIFLIRADWTKRNPEITKALAEYGRNSVPLYVFYPADRSAPKILPQILTVSMIEEMLKQKQ